MWLALTESDFSDIVRLLLLTGQRAAEVAGITRREIDASISEWNLPGERTKNRRPHLVPLSDPALEIIKKRLGKLPKDRELLFGSGRGPFSSWSQSKRALDKGTMRDSDEAIPHWTIHDLRRTVFSGMGQLGISTEVRETIVNHVSGHPRWPSRHIRSVFPTQMKNEKR